MERSFKHGLKVGLAAIVMVLGLAGCNTMEGLGQDIGDAGGAIEDKADESE